jgi:2-phosphoglycerate kinase
VPYRIKIVKRNGEKPFSQEQAVRSLTSVGMPFDEAFSFVANLQDELIAQNLTVLTVAELENRICEKLKSASYQQIADLYRNFRRVKTAGKPMIIFIVGATGCGKSTLATELAHRFRINRVLSTDVIRSIMRAMISPELMPSIHKSSFEAWRTYPFPFSDKVDPVLASFVDQASRVSVAVEAMVDRVIREKLHVIIEGVHLLPGIYEKFSNSDEIYFTHIGVGLKSEEEHRSRFVRRGDANKSRPGQRYLDNFESIRKIHDYVVDEAGRHDLKLFYQTDLLDLTNGAIKYILGQWK